MPKMLLSSPEKKLTRTEYFNFAAFKASLPFFLSPSSSPTKIIVPSLPQAGLTALRQVRSNASTSSSSFFFAAGIRFDRVEALGDYREPTNVFSDLIRVKLT